MKLNDALKASEWKKCHCLAGTPTLERNYRVLHRDDVGDGDVQLATEKIRQWSKKLTTSCEVESHFLHDFPVIIFTINYACQILETRVVTPPSATTRAESRFGGSNSGAKKSTST